MNYDRCTIRTVVVIVALLTLLATWAVADQEMIEGKPILEGNWRGEYTKYKAGDIVLMFQDVDAPAEEIARSVDGTLVRGVEPDGFAVIEVDQSADVFALCEELYADPRVKWAEPNMIHTIGEWNPNDAYYTDGTQWSLRNTGQDPPDGVPDADINANWAWDINHGSTSVVLAILDTGIDIDSITLVRRHYDLNESGKIILGLDATGDGYNVSDQHGHGTHVAGIAAAETDNTWGIAGVAEYCDILVIQVFNSAGSATEVWIRDGIDYAVNWQAANPSQRVIMNYSGGGTSYSAAIHTALQGAETDDVPFVTISHNDGNPTCRYPCQLSSDLDNLICVGATDPWDEKSDYSNYCDDVDVVAPGGYGYAFNEDDIMSCIPINSYDQWPGTSMAAPHVTGICGLIAAHDFSITALELKTLLRNTADDEVGSLASDPQGYDNKFGYGRANAWSALIHTYVTPYMRQNQRLSNTFSSAGGEMYYRLDEPTVQKWEVAAVRPHATVDMNVRWIASDGSTSLAFSGYGGEVVDFVCAHNRPTSGGDQYARIYNWSGTGKYSAEYEQAMGSYIGSMYIDDYEWESSHVVQLYELYLQDGHRYTFKVDMSSGEADLGFALMDRPAGTTAYYTQRADAVLLVDNNGNGGDESSSFTIGTGDGWYAFVIYNKNGRHGVMDIKVEDRLYGATPIVLGSQDGVTVDDGYYYHYMNTGNTMAAICVSPVVNYDYDMYLYSDDTYSGTALEYSTWGGHYEDFVLIDRAGISNGFVYPKVVHYSGSAATSGYSILSEVADEYLSIGSNGPYTFDNANVVHTWDVYMTSGTEYNFVGDITTGSIDIGIGLYRQDATYKSRSDYISIDYTSGAGVDEEITWTCDATGYYTVVAWNQNQASGTYYIVFDDYPNLAPIVYAGWDYEFVPRDTNDATFSWCPVSATLPGNTDDTYLNMGMRNVSGNPVPAITFYNQLILDGADNIYQIGWSTGMSPGYGWSLRNQTSSSIIRGGRHTIDFRVDGTNTITEHDEIDNNVARQFIWSPYVLTSDVAVVRDAPPMYSSSFPQPNADGFQYTKPAGYAYGVGILSTGFNEDINIRGYYDYAGSESGYDSILVSSLYGTDIDFFVGTYYGVDPIIYPGVYSWTTAQVIADYVIHASNAEAGQFNPESVSPQTVRDSLMAYEILNTYEAYLHQDSSYTFILDNLSGTADLGMAFYGPAYGYYNRSEYAAWSNAVGADEEINYVAPTTGWVVIAVFKNTYIDVPISNVYELTVMKSLPNLTYVDSPAGWDFPVVPRNAAGADTDNVVLTASLPGNTNTTYFNYHTYNDGHLTIPVSYWNYIFIDSTSWYGAPSGAGQAPMAYSWLINRQSSNTVKGGRHTVGVSIDRWDDVAESNEDDNWVERQFVWSPYVLAYYMPVTRSEPPRLGNGTYANCDGFEFTTGYWGAVGIIPQNSTADYNLRMHDPWIDPVTGFDVVREGSGWGMGQSDFIIGNELTHSGRTFDVGVVQDFSNPGTGNFNIELADEVVTMSPGTYGPYTLGAGEVLHLSEAWVGSTEPGTYEFEVEVVSGNADIGISLYDGVDSTNTKSGYMTGAFSNSAGPGGSESFSVYLPGNMYYGLVVWKEGSADLSLTSTFYIHWGILGGPVPMPVDDLVIERIGATTARLTWSQVTEDTSGSPLAVDYYRIHRNLDPNFVPSPADSIGYTTAPDTSYDDVNALWNYDKYFYQVIAVDTDGVDASQPGGSESGRVTTISVPSPAERQAIRNRRSQR